jgi:hypothetical protein
LRTPDRVIGFEGAARTLCLGDTWSSPYQVRPAVFAVAEAVRQAALVDLPRDELDGAVFDEQRRVEVIS